MTTPLINRDPQDTDLPDGLSNPARRALANAGVWRLEQLTSLTEDEVRKLHGVGPKAIDQLSKALSARGLSFAAEARKQGQWNSAMKATFMTTVRQEQGMNATGIPVPAEAVAALGTQKRPKVTVSLNGYSYRTTVAAYGEVFMLPLSAEHRNAAGVKAGDPVEVTIELDLEPANRDCPGRPGRRPLSQAGCRGCIRRIVVFDAQGICPPGRGRQSTRDSQPADSRNRRQNGQFLTA